MISHFQISHFENVIFEYHILKCDNYNTNKLMTMVLSLQIPTCCTSWVGYTTFFGLTNVIQLINNSWVGYTGVYIIIFILHLKCDITFSHILKIWYHILTLKCDITFWEMWFSKGLVCSWWNGIPFSTKLQAFLSRIPFHRNPILTRKNSKAFQLF